MKLCNHQIDASNYIATTPTAAGIICHCTGSGKSVTTIAGAIKSIKARKVNKHIFIATVSSISEICLDMEEHFHQKFEQVTSFHDLESFINNSHKFFAIMTYGILKAMDAEEIRMLFSQEKVCMYFDEAHELKNAATIVQTHVRSYRDCLAGLFLVTATPVMSSAKDLQGIFWLLEPSLLGDLESFYKVFSNFRKVCYVKKGTVRNCRCGGKYVYDGRTFICRKCGNSYEPKKQLVPISYKNQDVLAKLVAPYINSFFPPRDLRYYKIKANLSEEESKEYDAIAQDIVNIDKEEKTQHSTRMIELQHFLDNSESKMSIVLSLALKLRDQGMLIYADYLDSVEVLKTLLSPHKFEIRAITGALNAKARKETRMWFRKNSKNKVLIITKAGGASLNLQSTNNLIFYDIPFSVGNFIQVVGRVARYFSEYKHYNIFVPVLEDTLDDYKYNYVTSRRDFVSQVLQNACLPQGELDTYNSDLLADIRKRTLWKRTKS